MAGEHAEEASSTSSPIAPSSSGTDQPARGDVPMSEEADDAATEQGRQAATPSTTPPSPQPPGSSASVPASVADSIETVTPTLGGSAQTQVNVVNRGLPPRPSTGDKPGSSHQFYPPNLAARRHAATADNDNDSLISRSTAQRTTFSVGGTGRRPPSRSHIPAIMPAYSFYHPLRPPAVANASAAQQIPETNPLDEPERRPNESPATSSMQTDEGPSNSMHGKPSIEPLLPMPAVVKQDNSTRVLQPVIETASTRTSMLNTQILGNRTPTPARLPPIAIVQEKTSGNSQSIDKTRNWQHFPGGTHYHLGGRVQFGTQYFANIVTITLLLIPTGLYFAFPYPPYLLPSRLTI